MAHIVDEKQVKIKDAITIISPLNVSQKLLVSEVLKLVKLILVVPATNATNPSIYIIYIYVYNIYCILHIYMYIRNDKKKISISELQLLK